MTNRQEQVRAAMDDRTAGSAPLSMRPTLTGFKHMVSAGHYLAAHAAHEILEGGGNATDAGVAAGIALGVVQSDIVNFAGVAPILVYQADTQKVSSISGLGWWPRAASLDFFLKEHGGSIPPGILRTVIPAAPDAWITALERFGTMSFADVSAAAIRFADGGIVMYQLLEETIASNRAAYEKWPSNAEIYLPGGAVPRSGSIFRQRDLARSMQYMADEERAHAASQGRLAGLQAARNAFYRGDIARRIVDYHKANDGFLTLQDLDEFSVEVEVAQQTRFHGTAVYGCGFWCQGPVLLQMLNMLEQRDLAALGHNSSAYIHLLAEVIKLAFADRECYYTDPRHTDVPAEALLSKAYAEQRMADFNEGAAWPGMPPAGTLPNGGALSVERACVSDEHRNAPKLDTSYVAVVDRHGNAFSATPSDGSMFTPVIPGTGLCPSARGSQSWAQAGHAAAIGPHRRPRLTPNPSMAIRPDGYVMPFGSPGGDVQTQAMLQAFLNIEVFGMELQPALEAPRFASFSFPSSFEPHAPEPGRLMIEDLIDANVGPKLEQLGHTVQWWRDINWRSGGVCAVRHDLDSGIRSAGSDPRRPGYALGW